MSCCSWNTLKWIGLSFLILFAIGDSLFDSFFEVECTQNGKKVQSVISGDVKCVATTGFTFLYTGLRFFIYESSYEGQMALNKMNGWGRYSGHSGITFEGYFLEDLREGTGTFTSSDKNTTWSGTWIRDELTCVEGELTTKRADIFNKFSQTVNPINEAQYIGGVQQGMIENRGIISFYHVDQKKNQRERLFWIEADFQAGSIKTKPGSFATIRWNQNNQLMKNMHVKLQDWESAWMYGVNQVSGKVILEEAGEIFGYKDGHFVHLNSTSDSETTGKEGDVTHGQYAKEIKQVQLALEAIRAFEWHFIFHRMILDPITPLVDESTLSSTFEGQVDSDSEIKSEL